MKPTGGNRKIYRVRLDDEEREKLRGTVDGGGSRERRRRAHVLLLAAGERPGGGYMDAGIADVVGVGTSTVERIRRRCGGEGLEAALERKERLNRKKRVLDGTGEARLVTLACSRPPEGHAKWTLQLPGDRLVEPGLSTASRRKQLEEHQQKRYKPWKQKRWCIPPGQNADFVCAMEDVPGVYGREYGDDAVLVCMDETSRQLTKETRIPVPARPGLPARCDYEYERNGTANLFMAHAPLLGQRHVKVTKRRTKQDFAGLLKDIADVHFPEQRIVLVMDNLNTHKLSTLYEAFAPAEASRLARRFEVHHTPKHGSWTDMAEIEINVLARQCLDRRIQDRDMLRREVAAWERRRNAAAKPVNWRFRADDARIKLKSLYPLVQ